MISHNEYNVHSFLIMYAIVIAIIEIMHVIRKQDTNLRAVYTTIPKFCTNLELCTLLSNLNMNLWNLL